MKISQDALDVIAVMATLFAGGSMFVAAIGFVGWLLK